MDDAQLREALKGLRGWEAVESLIPGDYPRLRHELRKVYVFKTFKNAIRFKISNIDVDLAKVLDRVYEDVTHFSQQIAADSK